MQQTWSSRNYAWLKGRPLNRLFLLSHLFWPLFIIITGCVAAKGFEEQHQTGRDETEQQDATLLNLGDRIQNAQHATAGRDVYSITPAVVEMVSGFISELGGVVRAFLVYLALIGIIVVAGGVFLGYGAARILRGLWEKRSATV